MSANRPLNLYIQVIIKWCQVKNINVLAAFTVTIWSFFSLWGKAIEVERSKCSRNLVYLNKLLAVPVACWMNQEILSRSSCSFVTRGQKQLKRFRGYYKVIDAVEVLTSSMELENMSAIVLIHAHVWYCNVKGNSTQVSPSSSSSL